MIGNFARTASLCLLLIFAVFAESTFAAARVAPSAMKIGDITTFSGEVLVRSAGEWSRLSRTPYPLYNTDKVITKRGRAEIRLVDTGVMRMEANSNVTINQRYEGAGKLRTVAHRQANVLVGDVVFGVNLKQDGPNHFNVRTPGMIAAIRGTTFPVSVAASGETEYDLAGDATVSGGNRAGLLEAGVLESSDIDVPVSELPGIDREVARLPFQKQAAEAVKLSDNARRMKDRSDALEQIASPITDIATRTLANASAYSAAAATSLAYAEAAVTDAELAVIETEYMSNGPDAEAVAYYQDGTRSLTKHLSARLSEMGSALIPSAQAETNMDPVAFAKEALEEARNSLNRTRAAAELAQANQATIEECNAWMDDHSVDFAQPGACDALSGDAVAECNTCTLQLLRLKAAIAQANANLAAAEADVAVAYAQVAFAQAVGDSETAAAAQKVLEIPKKRAEDARKAAEFAESAYNQATQTTDPEALRLLVIRVETSMAAAIAAGNAAEAQQLAALAIIQSAYGKEVDDLENFHRWSDQAMAALDEAFATDDPGKAEEARRKAEEAAKNSENGGGSPIPGPGGPPERGGSSTGGGSASPIGASQE